MTSVKTGDAVRHSILHRELAYLLRQRNELQEKLLVLQRELDGKARKRAEKLVLDSLRAELDDALHLLEQQSYVLKRVADSRSWRLTRPARALANGLRRLLGRPAGMTFAAQLSIQKKSTGLVARSQSLQDGQGKIRLTFTAYKKAEQSANNVEEKSLAPHCDKPPNLRPRRLNFLVTSDCMEAGDDNFGEIRLRVLIQLLLDLGNRVVYASLRDRSQISALLTKSENLSQAEENLRRIGVEEFLYGVEDIRAYLRSAGHTLDIALLSRANVAISVLPLVRSYCPTTRVLYDIFSFREFLSAEGVSLHDDLTVSNGGDRQLKLEAACVRASDLTLTVSSEQKSSLLRLLPDAVIEVLPHAFDTSSNPPPGPSARKHVLLVGDFRSESIMDSVGWFVQRIWPKISAAEPGVRLHIVAGCDNTGMMALNAVPGVEAINCIADWQSVFDAYRVAVVPCRNDAGFNGKVGQALAQGLPVVTTAMGASGMGLRFGEQILAADNEEDFISYVICLLRDDWLWKKLSEQGRTHMQRNFSHNAIRGILDELISC